MSNQELKELLGAFIASLFCVALMVIFGVGIVKQLGFFE